MNRARYIRWILLVCLPAALAISAVPDPCPIPFADLKVNPVRRMLRNVYQGVVRPVLREGDREHLAKIEFDAANRRVIVRGKGETYYLKITDNPEHVYPHLAPPEVTIDEKGHVTATLVIHPEHSLSETNLRYTIGAFRSALRDGVLHPHTAAPGHQGPFVPSYPQREAVADLTTMALASREKNPNGPVKVGAMMPGGNGKTVVAAKYAHEIGQILKAQKAKGWKKPPKVLVLVNNVDLLSQMAPVFRREMGMTKFSSIFGDHLPASVDPNAELTCTTPISFLNRLEEFKKMMTEDPDQPWIIFLDEAHHTETKDGRFQEIRQFIDTQLDHRHHALAASAFFGYRDASLFRDFLGGNVHASGLTPEEQKQLREGKGLAELAFVQYVRAVMDGYAAPISQLEIASQEKYRDLLGASYVDKDGRHAQVYKELLDDMAERIRRNQQPGVPQRGIVYVDLTKRADAYAAELSQRLGVEVRAYHSGEESSPDAKDWIADRGKYATDADRRKHKFIVVVDSLNEGFDAPAINTVVFARNYQSTYAGFGYLRQNQARSERVHPANTGQFKPGVVVIDYSQQSLFLHQGLSQVMVQGPNRAHGGQTNVRIAQGKTDIVLDPVTFEARAHEFFPNLRNDFVFTQHFPFFKYDAFVEGGLPVVVKQARAMGVERWTQEPKVAKRFMLMLAERLPDGMPGKADLIRRLNDDAYWGWENGDARNAEQKIAPARRIYRALYEIAALYRLLPEGRAIDLTKLHEAGGMEDFLGRFVPELRPLRGQAEFEQFRHVEQGGLPVLMQVSSAMTPDAKPKQLLNLLEEAARRLPADAPGRAEILADLKAQREDWPDRDTQRLLDQKSEQSLAHPIYREWRRIAFAWNRAHPNDRVDPEKLLTREETNKLLAKVFGYARPEPLSAKQQERFKNEEEGAIAAIFDRSPEFGANSLQLDYGGRKWALGMVDAALLQYPNDPRLVALRADIEHSPMFDWKKYETFGEAGADRFHRVAYAIASVVRDKSPKANVSVEDLHTREGMENLMDTVTLGFALPRVPDRRLPALKTGGVTDRLQKLGPQLGIGSDTYYSDHGLKRVFLKLVEKAPESPAKTAFVNALNRNWFSKLDGEQARMGRTPALRRVQRAMHAAALVLNGGKPPTGYNEVFTVKDLEKLIEKSGQPLIP